MFGECKYNKSFKFSKIYYIFINKNDVNITLSLKVFEKNSDKYYIASVSKKLKNKHSKTLTIISWYDIRVRIHWSRAIVSMSSGRSHTMMR